MNSRTLDVLRCLRLIKLRRQRQDMKKRDAYEIEAVLKKTGEWELYSGNSSGKSRTLNYGIQRVFVRKEVAYDEEKCG